jgi:hypothetical protein
LFPFHFQYFFCFCFSFLFFFLWTLGGPSNCRLLMIVETLCNLSH